MPTVLNPYSKALEYREKFFLGVLPLPYKQKEQPPTGWTGREAGYPKPDKIKQWLGEKKQQNICIRLAGVDKDYELVGIDVDDYWKGDKKKNGWDQLVRLQNQYGKLPDTWISSARTDGRSGIRYFRVPRGLAFRGKIDKDIEVIQKGHRYAVVWPSVHPEGGTYWWFPPGTVPSSAGRKIWNGSLFSAWELPLLPEPWIDFLTNGKVLATEDGLIDVDSSVQDVYDWAEDTFHGEHDAKPCSLMRKKLDLHKKHVEDEATSHDKLTNGHWNLIRLAAEGHLGWSEAVVELESHFKQVTLKRGKRGLDEVNGEIFRSRIQALRKIKGQVDDRIKIGATAIDAECTKLGICGSGSADTQNLASVDAGGNVSDVNGDVDLDELADIPRGALKGVPEYELNDDGNAEHLFDMFSNLSVGPGFRYADGYGWIIWHEKSSSWVRDETGDEQIRRMWQKVKQRQVDYATALYDDWENKVKALGNGGNSPAGSAAGLTGITDIDVKIARAKYEKWRKFSEQSGNNTNAKGALEAARSITQVKIPMDVLDQNPYLMGVGNGVLELDRSDIRLRKGVPTDYITMNTGVNWEHPSEHAQNLWEDYLNTFLPDLELRRCLQIALGYSLLGGNMERKIIVLKGATTTGKSTMVDAVITSLGDYGQDVNQSIFQNHKLNPVLANALKKRIVGCSEFDDRDELSASQVKRIAGEDVIQVELKNSNVTIEQKPMFTSVLATNEVPKIAGADKALENRLIVFPFNSKASKDKPDQRATIRAICKTAIFWWLVEGYQQYRVLGELPQTQSMRDARKQFMSDLDEIQEFANEYLQPATSPQGYVSRKEVYEKYRMWCIEGNIQSRDIASMTKFTRRMKALGYQTPDKVIRVNGKLDRWWIGVRLAKSNVVRGAWPTVAVQSDTNSESDTP